MHTKHTEPLQLEQHPKDSTEVISNEICSIYTNFIVVIIHFLR